MPRNLPKVTQQQDGGARKIWAGDSRARWISCLCLVLSLKVAALILPGFHDAHLYLGHRDRHDIVSTDVGDSLQLDRRQGRGSNLKWRPVHPLVTQLFPLSAVGRPLLSCRLGCPQLLLFPQPLRHWSPRVHPYNSLPILMWEGQTSRGPHHQSLISSFISVEDQSLSHLHPAPCQQLP